MMSRSPRLPVPVAGFSFFGERRRRRKVEVFDAELALP